MNKRDFTYHTLFGALLLFGFVLRVVAVGHDIGFHPDERHIIQTTYNLSLAHPFPTTFAYGSFVFYLLKLAVLLVETIFSITLSLQDYYLVARSLSILCYLLTGTLLFFFIRQISSSCFAGLVGLFLLSVNPLHLQVSHYYTVDPVLTCATILFFVILLRFLTVGRIWFLFAATIVLGMSVALKISGALLLIPLTTALFLRRTQIPNIFRICCYLFLTGLLTFLALQPYTIFDPYKVASDIAAEIAMVKGAIPRPYTLQYYQAPPFLGHLANLWKDTLGAPTFLAAIAAPLALGLRQTSSLFCSIWVPWCIISLMLIGYNPVSFPRYLLPLYPILFTAIALFIQKLLTARITPLQIAGYIVAAVISGSSLILGVSQSSLYFQPHPWHAASRWIYANIPSGSTLLSPAWDDTLPVRSRKFQDISYVTGESETTIALFEQVSDRTLGKLSEQLHSAQYIIFPTTRGIRAVSQAPEKAQLGKLFLSALLSGSLGFEPLASFRSSKLFQKPGEHLHHDESLSVYDNPLVMIFKKTQPFDVQSLKIFLQEALKDSSDLITRYEGASLKTHIDTVIPSEPFPWRQVIYWIIILEIMWLSAIPLSQCLFFSSKQGGVFGGLSLGFFLSSLFLWIFYLVGLLSLRGSNLFLLFTISSLITLSLGYFSSISFTKRQFRRWGEDLILAHILIATAVLILFLLRASNPEIVWGEKPMDFSFLNYFTKYSTYPPHDPWAGGVTLSYHYASFFMYGLLHKITGLPTSYGYNISLITSGTLLVVTLFSLFRLLKVRTAFAYWSALAALVVSNGEAVRQLVFNVHPIGFDLFWSSTRTLAPPGFSEFPLWSYLFGDLHPHVTATPLGILILHFFKESAHRPGLRSKLHLLFGGTLLGFLVLWNVWDFPLYCGLYVLALLALTVRAPQPFFSKVLLWRRFGILVTGLVTGIAFFSLFRSPEEHGFELATETQPNSLLDILATHGVLIIPLFLLISWLLVRNRDTLSDNHGLSSAATVAFLPFLLAVVVAPWWSTYSFPFDVVMATTTFLLLCVLLAFRKSVPSSSLLLSILISVPSLVLLSELFVAVDRMNTLFKVHSTVWLWLFIALVLLYSLSERYTVSARAGLPQYLRITVSSFIFYSFLATAVTILCVLQFRRVEGHRPTLNGLSFLDTVFPALRTTVDTFHNLPLKHVVAQAPEPAYKPSLAFTTYTGIPAYLGWPSHMKQRGLGRKELLRRQRILRVIYSSTDAHIAHRAASLEGITLVVVSQFERTLYGAEGLQKFSSYPDLFHPLVNETNFQVYQVQALKNPS